jgi:hypothetical protein
MSKEAKQDGVKKTIDTAALLSLSKLAATAEGTGCKCDTSCQTFNCPSI